LVGGGKADKLLLKVYTVKGIKEILGILEINYSILIKQKNIYF